MNMKTFRRLGCLLLALTLTLGLLPSAVRAENAWNTEAIPYSLELSGERTELESSFVQSETYAPDEIVDVIVELEEKPLLSRFSTVQKTILKHWSFLRYVLILHSMNWIINSWATTRAVAISSTPRSRKRITRKIKV